MYLCMHRCSLSPAAGECGRIVYGKHAVQYHTANTALQINADATHVCGVCALQSSRQL